LPDISFETEAVGALDLTFEGIAGERHAGALRGADARTPWFPRGTPIRNSRQVSLVARDDLAGIAAALGIPAVEPGWLGANLVVSGLPHFSFLPRGARLFFPGEAVLAVEGMNAPCRFAGAAVGRRHPDRRGLDLDFPSAAKRLRGIVAWVERPGRIATGDDVWVQVPEQWIWHGDPQGGLFEAS
jgi:MOSC domain-containing protein YiiM